MNTKEFRAAVFGAIQTWGNANFPSLPIVYENGPVPDEDKIGPIWADVSVRWYGSTSLTVGEVVKGRHQGVISVLVFSREGQGTAQPDEILDSLSSALASVRLGSSTIRFPEHYTPTNHMGWYKVGLMFPFQLDV
jgi:Bacteriophage related domain of unknown function